MNQNLPFFTLKKKNREDDHGESLNLVEKQLLKKLILEKYKKLKAKCYKLYPNLDKESIKFNKR